MRSERSSRATRQPKSAQSRNTVSRPALLVDGDELTFRSFIHSFLAFTGRVERVRAGFAEMLGVTGIQYEILMVVRFQSRDHDVTVSDVARHLHRSGAFMTIETGKLAKRGWLDKIPDPADRRRVHLRLTDTAREQLAALAPIQREVNDVLFGAVEDGQLPMLEELFGGLVVCGDDAVATIQRLQEKSVRALRESR